MAIPQSMTMFWPVIDLLSTTVLIWSATSSGEAVDLRADLSVVALTLDSGNLLPLFCFEEEIRSAVIQSQSPSHSHSMMRNVEIRRTRT